MPTIKLANTDRHKICERIAAGEDAAIVARDYGITVVYARRLAAKTQKREAYDYFRFLGGCSLTLKDPTAYEIGKYKNGSPVIGYSGEVITPVVTFIAPFIRLLGKDTQGNPVELFIGKSAYLALQEIEAEGKRLNFKVEKLDDAEDARFSMWQASDLI